MRRILGLIVLSVIVSLTLTAVAFLFTRSDLVRSAIEARRGEPIIDAPEDDAG